MERILCHVSKKKKHVHLLEKSGARLAAFAVLFMSGCMLRHGKATVIEPTSVVVVDESRIRNTRVRTIFRESFMQEILKDKKHWLTVYNVDKSGVDDLEVLPIDYVISFDVMDYSTQDIEAGIDKIIVSARLIECDRNIINRLFMGSTMGTDIEAMCGIGAQALAKPLLDELELLRTTIYEVVDTVTAIADTAQADDQE